MRDAQDPPEDAFIEALSGEDELGVVVRAHIHVEAILQQLLDLFVSNPKHLEKMDLDFAQRVHLAVAIGLKEEYASPLLSLGTLRNAFAHRLDTTLTEGRVNNLYDTLSGNAKTKVHAAYERTKQQMNRTGPSFSKLGPKERFILISVVLRAVLLIAVRHAAQALGSEHPQSLEKSRHTGCRDPRPTAGPEGEPE